MGNIDKTLSVNLRKHRGTRTQEQIAEAAHIPFRTYQRIEAGTVPRKFEYLQSLADLYRVTVDRLFIADHLYDAKEAHLYNTKAIHELNDELANVESELSAAQKALTKALARIESLEAELARLKAAPAQAHNVHSLARKPEESDLIARIRRLPPKYLGRLEQAVLGFEEQAEDDASGIYRDDNDGL